MIDPSGVYWVRRRERERASLFSSIIQGYFGCAIGKGKQAAKTEIEKLKVIKAFVNDLNFLQLEELTCREAIKEAAKM